MSASHLLAELSGPSIKLSADGDPLRIQAPRGALTAELRSRIAESKPSPLGQRSHQPLSLDTAQARAEARRRSRGRR